MNLDAKQSLAVLFEVYGPPSVDTLEKQAGVYFYSLVAAERAVEALGPAFVKIACVLGRSPWVHAEEVVERLPGLSKLAAAGDQTAKFYIEWATGLEKQALLGALKSLGSRALTATRSAVNRPGATLGATFRGVKNVVRNPGEAMGATFAAGKATKAPLSAAELFGQSKKLNKTMYRAPPVAPVGEAGDHTARILKSNVKSEAATVAKAAPEAAAGSTALRNKVLAAGAIGAGGLYVGSKYGQPPAQAQGY